MPQTLPKDATIKSIWNSLVHKRAYGTGVFWKMKACAKLHPDVYVRIGITGSGQKPCYRIFYFISDDADEHIDGSFWDTGDPLDNEHASNANWSTAAMSLADLEHLLREKLASV